MKTKLMTFLIKLEVLKRDQHWLILQIANVEENFMGMLRNSMKSTSQRGFAFLLSAFFLGGGGWGGAAITDLRMAY